MSAVYNLEPQPTAKVLLQTTSGDLLLELFAKQTPLTARNFLQLCLDGYYDNTIFHRLVPGFIIQGGDPSGTGQGGESSYNGEPFADEFHSRLKFNRRGLLGMANSGQKDDNGSQFFLTLGETPELNGKNTMFGRIVGDTIYNLMKMADAELAEEGGERPLYPTKITGTEILVSPFNDMVKKVRTAERVEEKKDKKKPKRKAGKALLSFGIDEEDEEDATPVFKKPKFNPKLVRAGQENKSAIDGAPVPHALKGQREENMGRSSTNPEQQNRPFIKEASIPNPPLKAGRKRPSSSPESSLSPPFAGSGTSNLATERRVSRSRSRSLSSSPTPGKPVQPKSLLDETNAQIAALKASMKRNVKASTAAPTKPKSVLEEMIPATSTRGRRRLQSGSTGNSREERHAFDLFRAFKSKLEAAPEEGGAIQPARLSSPKATTDRATDKEEPHNAIIDDPEAELCDLHFIPNCQSCNVWNAHRNKDEGDDKGWMAHKLSFAKDRLGKDLEWKRRNEDELVVIDPREKERDIRTERRRGRGDRGRDPWREDKYKDKNGGRERPLEREKRK